MNAISPQMRLEVPLYNSVKSLVSPKIDITFFTITTIPWFFHGKLWDMYIEHISHGDKLLTLRIQAVVKLNN